MERMGTASFCIYKTWPWLPPALLERKSLPQHYVAASSVMSFGPALFHSLREWMHGLTHQTPSISPKHQNLFNPWQLPVVFTKKSFIWKLSINKVDRNQQLAKLRYWCNRWKQIGNGWAVIFPIHEDKEREAAHSCSLSLLHQPHLTSACPKNQFFWSTWHVQEDPGQGVFSCVESCRCENALGVPWYLWVFAKGCLYPY